MKGVGPEVFHEVEHRDIGTEMTPLGSSINSRCHTPIKAHHLLAITRLLIGQALCLWGRLAAPIVALTYPSYKLAIWLSYNLGHNMILLHQIGAQGKKRRRKYQKA